MSVYKRWVTVTSFPLMYFSHRHALPVRYLNLSSHATDSYQASTANGHKQPKQPFWKRKPGMFDDWQRLHQELAMYRSLCDIDSTGGYAKWEKISKAFEAKRDAHLEAEHFKTSKTDDDERWRYPDTGETYWNSYLSVAFQNFNLNREFGAQHWFTDFHQEDP